jgi:hypothetical protein
MNTLDPRAEARNRANRRLRRMTIGTTVLGVASVGILGATAAFTYDGTFSAGDAVALVETGATSETTTTRAATATSTPSTTATSTSATNHTVSSSSGSAHASTGWS